MKNKKIYSHLLKSFKKDFDFNMYDKMFILY